MKKSSILVIDDEQDIRELLTARLSEKYSIFDAANGAVGIEKAKTLNPSLILLDLKMPNQSGFDVCRVLRENPTTQNTPIIILSGSSETNSLVESFKLGADDFIEKPFQFEELIARVDSKIYRHQKNVKKAISYGDISVDIDAMSVHIGPKQLHFSKLEFNILHFFIKNAECAISRERLIDSIWNNINVSDRTVDTHIVSLRKKLLNSKCKVNTIYGVGYKLCIENSH